MKRLFIRIGVLAFTVVLGLIAFAYAQRANSDKSGDNTVAENVSPLRGNAAQTASSSNSATNPLRDNRLRAGPPVENSTDKNFVVDSRIKKVAAEVPAADPLGLTSHKEGSATDAAAPRTLSSDSIPDAAALDPPGTNTNADQSRNSPLAGPSLIGPTGSKQNFNSREAESNPIRSPSKLNPANAPMVERYAAGGSSADRSVGANRTADRIADAGRPADRLGNRSAGLTTASSNSQEPAPFKADPFSEPTALSQTRR